MTDTNALAEFNPAEDFAAALVALLPADQLNVDPEQLRKLLADAAAPITDQLRPLGLRARAMELQAQAGGLLDEADALEAHADLAKAAHVAEQAYAAAVAEAERLSSAVRELVAAERTAVDKLAAAAEHARLVQERVEELALAEAAPAVQSQAILERNAAEQVAGQFRARAEQAAAERVSGEASLTAARAVVRQCRTAVKAAQDALANPAVPPVSAITATLDGLRRLAMSIPMDPGGEASAMDLLEALATKTGLARMFRNQGRVAEREEQRQRAQSGFLPTAGAPRRAGAVITPPGTASIAPLVTSTR